MDARAGKRGAACVFEKHAKTLMRNIPTFTVPTTPEP